MAQPVSKYSLRASRYTFLILALIKKLRIYTLKSNYFYILKRNNKQYQTRPNLYCHRANSALQTINM